MLLFVLRRIVSTIPVLFVVAVIVFLMTRLAPGDPAASIAGNDASEATLKAVRASLGLSDPLWQQFSRWLLGVLHGHLGESFFMRQQVSELIRQRIEPTLSLAAVTVVITVALAVPLGVLAAARHGGWLDRALMGFSALGFSVPVFVTGYVLIWIFALHLQLLPVQGYSRIGNGVVPWIRSLVLPSVTLSIVYLALIARVTRAAVAEALTEDFIRTARSKSPSDKGGSAGVRG